mgnify:CR=1 FL=1
MKRMKKILTGLLTLAMTLSMMTMTAFAADGSGTTATTKMPTIDKERTGSITIHKYEYNGTGGVAGTGNADDTIPDGATPLAGVEYTVWKISDLTNYYEYNSTEKLPKATDFTVEKDGSSWKLKKNGTLDGTLIGSQTTGATGVVTFGGLAVGIYYVNETKAPDKVYSPVAASQGAGFLVSIPMTNPKNNDEWLYDVNVFPKNKTASGGVILTKQGKCGTEESVLEGAEFVLQKKFDDGWKYVKKDTTGGSWKYDVTAKPTTSADGILKTNASGTITVTDLAHGTYRFLEVDSTDDPGNGGYIIDETKEYEFTVNTDGTIVWAAAAEGTKVNGTTSTPATITIVNYKPNVEKDVKDRTDPTWGKNSDYSVGDTIPYRVTVDVPENIAQLKTFTLTDKPTNQKYQTDTLKIYSDDTFSNQILDTYVGTADGDGWKIEFTPDDLKDYKGSKIYITFDMKLKENAVIVGPNGNTNEIKLDYSNKILPTSDPNHDTPGTDEIKKETTVYTFELAVEKEDASDTTKKLEGVTFDLYRELDSAATGEGVLTDPVKGLTGKFKKVKENLRTKTDGTISVPGLANGDYWLVETKTIENYNLLKKPIKVQIAATYSETETITINTDSTGKTTTTTTKVKNLINAGNNGVFKTVVKNSKGFTLPTTGGIGTFVFTFAGIAMMAAAVILLITSKKKKAE